MAEAGTTLGERMRRGEREVQSMAGPTLVVETVVIMGMLKCHCCPSIALDELSFESRMSQCQKTTTQ